MRANREVDWGYSVPSVSANATIPYPYIPTESLSTSHGAIGEGCYQLVSDGAERVVVQSGVGGYRSPQKSRNPMNWCQDDLSEGVAGGVS